MLERKKKRNKRICFYFLAVMIGLMTSCGKKEEMTLDEIRRQSVSSQVEEEEVSGRSDAEAEENSKKETSDPEEMVVYVCGKINAPGVYRLPAGSRICDAIEAAGGMSEEAAPDVINQAEHLLDGQRVYVPSQEEAEAPGFRGPDAQTGSASADASGRISINAAGKDELMRLPGIGSAKADAIIAYREANGGFSSVEELMQVEGIKEGTFQKIKDSVTL